MDSRGNSNPSPHSNPLPYPNSSNPYNPDPHSNPYPSLNPSYPNPYPSLYPSNPLCHDHFNSSLPSPLCNPNPNANPDSYTYQNNHNLSINPSGSLSPWFISSSSSSSSSSSYSPASSSSSSAIAVPSSSLAASGRFSESLNNLFTAQSYSYGDSYWEEFVADDEEFAQKYYGVPSIDELITELSMRNYDDVPGPSNYHFSDCASVNPTLVSADDPTRTMLFVDADVSKSKPGLWNANVARVDEDDVVCIRVSSVDLRLFDGYFWRKYGEKHIKNQKFPRSYFKCAESGCKVRKRAERCWVEPNNFVIITYNGRHNHPAQHL